MIVYADVRYRLEALGLHDARRPLVLQAVCQRCDQLLSKRLYDGVPDGELDAVINAHAAADAETARAHVCEEWR